MKAIVRKQSSARPRSCVEKTVKKKRRGGTAAKRRADDKDFYMVKGHDNVQMRSSLAKMTKREARRLSLTAQG